MKKSREASGVSGEAYVREKIGDGMFTGAGGSKGRAQCRPFLGCKVLGEVGLKDRDYITQVKGRENHRRVGKPTKPGTCI